jgi:uncharacterized protein
MITRRLYNDIIKSLEFFPVVGIIGPRQVGKTTLAKQIIENSGKPSIYLDLELPTDQFKLENAELFLSQQQDKLIVIDEVQISKELFPILRALVDKTGKPGQFILLGSASPELIRDSSESLAGRIAYHRLHPLDMTEIPENVDQNTFWFKGGFPDALLATNDSVSHQWMLNFVNTYLNRDLLMLGLKASPIVIRNLWTMLAHLNGQLLNTNHIAKSLGVTSPTIKRYIDFLEEAFLLNILHPFTWNISKRLVKSPKIYISDTGILHHLLGIENFIELSGNPIIGSSWESFVINQIHSTKKEIFEMYFYRTQQGAELDLVLCRGLNVLATVEIKYTNTPHLSKGNYLAMNDLNATMNFVITPSSDDYLLNEKIRICSLKNFLIKYLNNL